MARFVLYPELAAEMARRGDKQYDIAKIIGINSSQVNRRLNGDIRWSTREIELISEHYNIKKEYLFQENEREEIRNEILEN